MNERVKFVAAMLEAEETFGEMPPPLPHLLGLYPEKRGGAISSASALSQYRQVIAGRNCQ
jgi:hypothetical protein